MNAIYIRDIINDTFVVRGLCRRRITLLLFNSRFDDDFKQGNL